MLALPPVPSPCQREREMIKKPIISALALVVGLAFGGVRATYRPWA